jgi:hypothetical protein
MKIKKSELVIYDYIENKTIRTFKLIGYKDYL